MKTNYPRTTFARSLTLMIFAGVILAGCLSSDRPRFDRKDLISLSDLAGFYIIGSTKKPSIWYEIQAKTDGGYDLIKRIRNSSGAVSISESSRIWLLFWPKQNTYLFISSKLNPNGEPRKTVTYALLETASPKTWRHRQINPTVFSRKTEKKKPSISTTNWAKF